MFTSGIDSKGRASEASSCLMMQAHSCSRNLVLDYHAFAAALNNLLGEGL